MLLPVLQNMGIRLPFSTIGISGWRFRITGIWEFGDVGSGRYAGGQVGPMGEMGRGNKATVPI